MPITTQTPVISYVANGSVGTFSFPFKILVSSDLKVYSDGVLVSSGLTITGVGNDAGGSVAISPIPTAGKTIRLQRVVPLDRSTDYVEGGQLAAATLDNDFDRTVMQLQDLSSVALKEASDGTYSAGSKRISNVADPVNAQDATSKAYVDTTLPYYLAQTTTQANNAAASASAAATSATNAATSASGASTSASAASTSATNAAASASAASTSETNAAASASAASTSASSASTSATSSLAAASTASTSATNAAASASAASTSATNAANSASAASTSATNAASSASAASTSATNAATSAMNAANSATAAAASATSINLPSITGGSLKMLRVKADETGYEFRTTSQILADIGAIGAASPTFTGTPSAPTASANTNTTQIATTAFVIGTANTYAKPQKASAAALTSASAVDASTYQSWTANVNGGAFTVANPTGGVTDAYYALFITFTTSHSVSFGNLFKGITNYTPSATAGAKDSLIFRFDGTNYDCVGIATGVSA